MRLSERRRAMLREMGIRLWLPESALLAGGADGATGAASEVALLDWPALAQRAAACTACALCAGRTRSVFGAGRLQADWMVVGDAPERDDDREGVPFAGAAGQLLDNMLAAIGLSRGGAVPAQAAYVTHAVKCLPPGERNPEPAEAARCEPFLSRQVELVRPRIILAMGRFATQSLLRSTEAIGKLRGRVHRYNGIALVATYAPAYLLRHPEDKADAWEDLCLALETVKDSSFG